jgi:hypothetical protein
LPALFADCRRRQIIFAKLNRFLYHFALLYQLAPVSARNGAGVFISSDHHALIVTKQSTLT